MGTKIPNLAATTAPLANNDLAVVEKADGSGTKKMTFAELSAAMQYPISAIPQNVDLNTYTTPGKYYCNSNSTAATITNSPVARAFRLTVEPSTSPTQTGNIRQTLKPYQNNITFTRWTTTGGSTWSEWAVDGDGVVAFHLENAASVSFTMKNNFAAIMVQRGTSYQLYFLDYWTAGATAIETNGQVLLTVTKAANSYAVTVTNNVSTQTVGLIFNPTSETRLNA